MRGPFVAKYAKFMENLLSQL